MGEVMRLRKDQKDNLAYSAWPTWPSCPRCGDGLMNVPAIPIESAYLEALVAFGIAEGLVLEECGEEDRVELLMCVSCRAEVLIFWSYGESLLDVVTGVYDVTLEEG
jgi:hypothetical protein